MLGIVVTPTDERLAAHKRFADRWAAHYRRLQLWVEVMELDDNGEYTPVGAALQKGVRAGPVLQVRVLQGVYHGGVLGGGVYCGGVPCALWMWCVGVWFCGSALVLVSPLGCDVQVVCTHRSP